MIYLGSDRKFKIDVTTIISGGNYIVQLINFKTRQKQLFTMPATQEKALFAEFEFSVSDYLLLKKDEHELKVYHLDYSAEKPIFTGILKVL